ncbi:MAG: LptE family protein [Candidatus Marinimicrobia bacterium]|nr:LptE family protein [Candidatus Neomarinimicrobiota bacterium]
MRNKKVYLLGIIFILINSQSCWYYSFKGTIPPHIKSIAIQTFDNQTGEFNIEQDITEKVRRYFIQENILKVRDEDNSDSILSGRIVSIRDEPLIYEDTPQGEEVTEYRLTISLSIEWYDRINDKVLLKKQFSKYADYDPSGLTENTREKAIESAVMQICEDIMNNILGIW